MSIEVVGKSGQNPIEVLATFEALRSLGPCRKDASEKEVEGLKSRPPVTEPGSPA